MEEHSGFHTEAGNSTSGQYTRGTTGGFSDAWYPIGADYRDSRSMKPGVKEDHKAEQFYTMPWNALREVARVYKYGGQKYGPYNYLAGYPYSKSIDAGMRHLTQWLSPDEHDIDEESDLHHLAHAAWHVLNLLEMSLVDDDYDDRQGKEFAIRSGYYEATGFHTAGENNGG